MYSLVVMATLTTGGDAPTFGHKQHCYTSCHSCYSCWGCACYGPVHCSGYGYCSGSCSYCSGCCSCYGWSGSYGCYGCCYSCTGNIHCSGWGCHCWGAPMYMETVPMKKEKEEKKDKEQTARPDDNRARLVIDLPADAKLSIDDQPMKATSAQRSFHTPTLQKGQTYYYILKVEVTRGVTPISESRRVLIRAGEEVNVSFSEESIAAAAKSTDTASR